MIYLLHYLKPQSDDLSSSLFAPKKPSIFDRVSLQNTVNKEENQDELKSSQKEEVSDDDLIIPDFLKD